ncbi:hypothetical protein [Aeromonas phage 59.1]|nr:hypothetical protein [Aeromonas phage 59.1]
MGVLVFKFILWGVLLSALWGVVKLLFRAPVVVVAWAIERHGYAAEEREYAPIRARRNKAADAALRAAINRANAFIEQYDAEKAKREVEQ